MKQHIEYEIEWPEDTDYQYYLLPLSNECQWAGGFWRSRVSDSIEDIYCHVIIERPREVCGKEWKWHLVGAKWVTEEGGHRCTLDAGHDQGENPTPCMMELGEAE